jgi:dCTP deaminase
MSLLSDRELENALATGEECYEKWYDGTEGLGNRWLPASGADFLPADALWIDPLSVDAIQPASVDLCLGGQFVYWAHPSRSTRQMSDGRITAEPPVIDPMTFLDSPNTNTVTLGRLGDTFDVQPGAFVLAHTLEIVAIGACLAGQIYGKSSIGRTGLEVENAGYMDPGFLGQVTLELKNTTEFVIRLTVGMPIAQVAMERLSSPATRPYGHPSRGSRYAGQMGATPSRYAENRAPIGKPSLRAKVAERVAAKTSEEG